MFQGPAVGPESLLLFVWCECAGLAWALCMGQVALLWVDALIEITLMLQVATVERCSRSWAVVGATAQVTLHQPVLGAVLDTAAQSS